MGVYLHTLRTKEIKVAVERPGGGREFATANILRFHAAANQLSDGWKPTSVGQMLAGRMEKIWSERPTPKYAISCSEDTPQVGDQLVRWDSDHTARAREYAGAAWWDSEKLHVVGVLTGKGPNGWTVALTDQPGKLDEIEAARREFMRLAPGWREQLSPQEARNAQSVADHGRQLQADYHQYQRDRYAAAMRAAGRADLAARI